MATGYILVDSPNPYTAQGTYPRRGIYGQLSGTCIVHTSEGAWQAGVASLTNLVRTRSDYGCYHRAVDWQDIALYYPWEWETWQDSETNNWAVGISAACRTTDWGNMPADVEEGYYRNLATCAADFVKYMATKGVTVPLRRISGAEARARVPGFAAHGDSGVGRTDPGVNFSWTRFFQYTSEALGGFNYSGGTTDSGDDELNGEQNAALARLDKAVAEIYARVFGRDVQRWYDPANPGDVRLEKFAGSVPARSTDVNDVLSTNKLLEQSTNRILDALSKVQGVDDSVIAGLREQLAADLKAATEGISVTLKAEVKPAE